MNENCFFHELASPSEIAELPRYPPKSQIPRHNVVKSAAGWIRRLFGNKIQSFGSFVRSSSTLSNIQTDAVDDENGGFAYRDRQSAVAAAPPTKFCMFALKADYNKYPLLPSPPAPAPQTTVAKEGVHAPNWVSQTAIHRKNRSSFPLFLLDFVSRCFTRHPALTKILCGTYEVHVYRLSFKLIPLCSESWAFSALVRLFQTVLPLAG